MEQDFNLYVFDIVHGYTRKFVFTHSLAKQKLSDEVWGKTENTFGETIFIGYVTSMLLNKSLNMMLIFQQFASGHNKYLGIILLLFTDQTVWWTVLMLSLVVLDHF